MEHVSWGLPQLVTFFHDFTAVVVVDGRTEKCVKLGQTPADMLHKHS